MSHQSSSVKIVTAILQSHSHYYEQVSFSEFNKNRLAMLFTILHTYADYDILLFPAGFLEFETFSRKRLYDAVSEIQGQLHAVNSSGVVCFGADSGEGRHQLAIAVDQNGICAAGRKFYPTSGEQGQIRLARHFHGTEMGFSRIFSVNGHRFYLAVCYDCFGIRHKALPDPGVDCILTLVHQFYPRGEGLSGDVDFARKGFGGASLQWGCPVLGAAAFFDRRIPENWPAGVLCDTNTSIRHFKYSDNQIHDTSKQHFSFPDEEVRCDCYTIF